jgi:putative zinc finger protein
VNCLDAETLAAWMDGGLSGAALEQVQLHVADCARCQALVGAMGRTRVAVPPTQPERAPRWWLAWAVPLTAAATAVAIWIAVPHQNSAPSPPSAEIAPAPSVAVPAPSVEKMSPSAEEKQSARRQVERTPFAPQQSAARREADTKEERALAAPPTAPPPAAPPAAAAPAPEPLARAAAQSANVLADKAATTVAFPCGPQWTAPPPAGVSVVAGSTPTPGVCWIVGRGGLVMRSTDGRNWQRVPFPETVDLSAVQATDARTVTISTSDGRTFSTSDGGVSWAQR